MKLKRIAGSTGLILLFGALFHVLPQSFHPEPILAPTYGDNTTPTFAHKGHVMAHDDDPTGVSVRQDNKAAPQTKDSFAYSSSPKLARAPKMITIDNKQYPLRTYKPLLTSNDPYAGQWWETNTKLPSAWDIPRGTTETTLAIIDTGFALNHEEFTNRWYTNAGESGAATSEAPSSLNCSDHGQTLDASCNLIDDDFDGIVDNESGSVAYQNPSRLNCSAQSKPLTKDCNRIDDEHNGYIDDVSGWDFINSDNSPQAGELNPVGNGTTHGTMVAGVAAATGNNGKGIAGVDWGTKILPIQALDDDSYGDTLSVGRAIYYAVNQGADVISISLGSDQPDDYIREAVQAALAKGIVVVAASGNDGCDCMVYPAHYPEVLAVGALNTSNQPASFSSWGDNLDVLAPGTQLTSSTWSNTNQSSAYVSGINGTSFATPMVGGMLTRLLSQQPSVTPQQLVAALSENTNRLTLASNMAHTTTLGFGTLDAAKATNRMATPVSTMQQYAYTPISLGDYLSPTNPFDQTGNYLAYQCETTSSPATAIYELKNAASSFFTISKVEQQQALSLGYSSGLFAYGCIQQPHDKPNVIRALNIFREFRNSEPPKMN